MLNIEDSKILTLDSYTILENINLQILPATINIIIGPNGAGKTSLINAFANPEKLICGKFSSSFEKSILIPQNIYYPEGITLFEYISSIFYRNSWKWWLTNQEKDKIDEILDRLSIRDKKDLYLNQLSSGELQLANIALCIISEANMILLDEPSANLDLSNQVVILEILKNLANEGITIIAVMHDINLAQKYGNKFISISKNGKLISGNRSEIFTRENLFRVYDIDFSIVNIDEKIFIQPNI